MNRYVRPVMFAFEPDVVHQFSLVTFGATGSTTINTLQSKGICGFSLNTISITGTTASSSTTVSGVSSYVGLYVGMTVSDGGVHIPANTTISSMTPASGTITLSQNATGTNTGLSVYGGQYMITFGRQLTPTKQLDTYVKLLGLNHNWDETSLQGATGTAASAPAAPSMFLVQNNITNTNLANLVVQFGSGAGSSFVAYTPASGEQVRVAAQLCRSNAI